MIEITLLKALSKRHNFDNYKRLINPKSLAQQSLVLLKDYDVYFSLNQNETEINFDKFCVFFFNTRHPTFDDKSVAEYRDILTRVATVKSDDIKQVINGFRQQDFYGEIQGLIDQNVELEQVKSKIDEYMTDTGSISSQETFNDMDLNISLDYTDRSNGLVWRCEALKRHFQGGLIVGDFGLVAGYVDSGKTSFVASELSHMAQQLSGDDYILWLSNEGDWKSILPRVYCAALNLTKQEVMAHKDEAIKRYKQLMHGDLNRIIIKDIQGYSAKDIEALIKRRTPKLVVIDLLDHIDGFDKYSSKESSFEKYNKLYQWAREMATHYAPILGVTQLNGDGEDQMYPSMSQLRGSRVDKQAAATFQLMIGSMVEDNNTRYLSMPKNKINENKSWKAIVKFDPARSRFI